MLSYEMRTAIRSLFGLEASASDHGKDNLKVLAGELEIYNLARAEPSLVDRYAIAVRLAEIFPPLRPIEKDDPVLQEEKELEIESEWKHALCSGE